MEKYLYSGGQFVNVGNTNWQEWQQKQLRFHFKETERDNEWIYLHDTSRDIWVALPVGDGKSYYKRGDSDWTELYEVRIAKVHDMKSPCFADDPILQSVLHGERLLQSGDEGSAIQKIQQALIDAGFPLPKYGADSDFESETETAVRSYQSAHGLEANGIIGTTTMESLDAQFASAPPPSMNMIPVNSYINAVHPFNTYFAQKYKRHDGIVMDENVNGRGSAVLVHENIVLTAAHVVRQIHKISEATVTFNREIDHITNKLSTNRPWGYIKKLLEVADPPLDYALLEIAWHGDRNPGVPVARIDHSGVSMDQPIFGFHHPMGQPTHVSKGTVLLDQISPNESPPKNAYFTSGDLMGQKGSSGGGIYNNSGELVGIFHACWAGTTADVEAVLIPLWKGRGVEGTYIMHSTKGIYEHSSLFSAIVGRIPHTDLPDFIPF